MNTIKAIRNRLGVTQAAMAGGIGCTQANVGHYERGQTVPPVAAKRLISYAASLGHTITFNDIYDTSSDPILEAQLTEAAKAGLIEQRVLVRRADDRSMHQELQALKGQGA